MALYDFFEKTIQKFKTTTLRGCSL